MTIKNTTKILVIEDDQHIMRALLSILENENYQLSSTASGIEALKMAKCCPPDLFLLDLGLPDIDGIQVIQQLRQQTARPIIIISARTQENEMVAALDYGADDYITKPFSGKVLQARIRSALRHTYVSQFEDSLGRHCYTVDDLCIDYRAERVTIAGKDVHLTNTEYQIVSLISGASGKVVTYRQIIAAIWGPYADADNNRALRVNMANIRRKIELNPASPKYIFTDVGLGYRMAPEKISITQNNQSQEE